MSAVLSLGAGPGQVPLIRAAKQLGYEVIAVDRSPTSEALSLADEMIIVSIFDVDRVGECVLKLNSRYDICAVLARTSGPALLTAEKLTEKLGLSGISKNFAAVAVSKSELRQQAHSLGISTPQGIRVTDCKLPDMARPWVVKPDVPLVGKKNVYKVSTDKEYQQAYTEARTESYNEAIEVGRFVAGVDVGFMTIVQHGNIQHDLLYDEFTNFTNGKVKGLGIGGPSVFSATSIEVYCRDVAQKLLSYWRYQTGFAFFSFRINRQNEILLYEVNPGLCGDAIADQLLPALWPSFDPFSCDVKLQVGDKPDLPGNVNGQHLVLNGQLMLANNVGDYLSHVGNLEGGAGIVATSRAIIEKIRT